MSIAIDSVLSQTSEENMESDYMSTTYSDKGGILDHRADTDNGIWCWYSSNIKQGRFEEITGNKTNKNILIQVLNKYFKEEVDKKNSQFKLLILSIPAKMMNMKGDIENFVLNQFKIKNNEVIKLNGCNQGGYEEDALYLIPIYEHDFHILQAYHRNFSARYAGCSDQTMSHLQSFESIPSVLSSDLEYESPSDMDEDSESMEIPKIYSSDNSEFLAHTQNNNDDEDDDERDAIILNFTRSYIRNHHIIPNTLYHTPSDLSESMSVLSIQSNDYDYDDEEERNYTSELVNRRLHGPSKHEDDGLSLQYIYPSLSRAAPKNGSLVDINLRVCHILAKEYDSDIMWHSIRQSHGEDWLIYDAEFSMSNLQYCQLDDILTGRLIDDNENDTENTSDNTPKHMMVLFCEVI